MPSFITRSLCVSAGFIPLREDFELEHDNDAEVILAGSTHMYRFESQVIHLFLSKRPFFFLQIWNFFLMTTLLK